MTAAIIKMLNRTGDRLSIQLAIAHTIAHTIVWAIAEAVLIAPLALIKIKATIGMMTTIGCN
jgi:hypothetical protein